MFKHVNPLHHKQAENVGWSFYLLREKLCFQEWNADLKKTREGGRCFLTICLLKLATISSKTASRVSSALPSFCKTCRGRQKYISINLLVYPSINLFIYESIYPSIRLSVYYLSIFVSFHSWCFIQICNWRHVSVYFQAACQSHMTPTSAVCVCVCLTVSVCVCVCVLTVSVCVWVCVDS